VKCGCIKSQVITIINNGLVPVSLPSSRDTLQQTGFSCEMPERIIALPPGEKLDLVVKFDPSLLAVKDAESKASLFFNVSCVERLL